MIAHLSGGIIDLSEKEIVLDVHGVGYRVSITQAVRANAKLGSEISLWTHLAVRDDAMDLFGFVDKDERSLFELLLSVSGIGPKSAMNVLSVAGSELLRRSISSNDPSYLTKVSGIGKKTAEKIVLELRDKVVSMGNEVSASTGEHEALDALEALGYSIRDTRDIVRSIATQETEAGEIIKQALKALGK